MLRAEAGAPRAKRRRPCTCPAFRRTRQPVNRRIPVPIDVRGYREAEGLPRGLIFHELGAPGVVYVGSDDTVVATRSIVFASLESGRAWRRQGSTGWLAGGGRGQGAGIGPRRRRARLDASVVATLRRRPPFAPLSVRLGERLGGAPTQSSATGPRRKTAAGNTKGGGPSLYAGTMRTNYETL